MSDQRRESEEQRSNMPENVDEAKGRAKSALGELTDDEDKKNEGTVDKAAGAAKDFVDSAADKAKELVGDEDEDEQQSG